MEIDFGRDIDCLAAPDQHSLPVTSLRPDALESALATLPPGIAAFIHAQGFRAEPGQLAFIPGPEGEGAGLIGAWAGLGTDRSIWAHGHLATALPTRAWHLEPGDFDHDAAILAFCLGAYRFDALTSRNRPLATLTGTKSQPVARAIWLARDLINTPPNLLGPAELADAAVALAARHGATPSRTEGAALDKDYPAIAAVGRGSTRPPVVAGFDWQGSNATPAAKHIWLCGKGVTFDSGGYDLKPAAGMLRMKKDMGGAALMLGLADAIMALDLPLRLSLRIGCVENMVSGDAMRPLDVITTRRGLTVEIGNTDAEGRLVLCDLLAEAADATPDLILDAATLTGAARVALGPDIPALFTPDDALAANLAAASHDSADPVWRMPLHAGYDPWLSSPVADLGNVTSKPYAGAIIAALFLQRFVPPCVSWAHLDTYAWNDATGPGRPEGGEAQALRCLLTMIGKLTLG